MENEPVKLRVNEADQDEVGRYGAFIDPEVIESEGLNLGDIIMIKGDSNTCAIVFSGGEAQRGTSTIGLDGLTRKNAGVHLSGSVLCERVNAPHASKVSLYLLDDLKLKGGEEFIHKMLTDKPLTLKDRVEISVFGRKISFDVASYSPGGAAILVDKDTKLKISKGTIPEGAIDGSDGEEVKTLFEDIGGLTDEIGKVREMVELPLRHPELFEKVGIDPPKGLLLHGPPGTGKTLIARALAGETKAGFYTIGGPEIMSKFYGESEERLRRIFTLAQQNAPSILFIDEIDSIAPKREEVTGEVERRVVAQLLALMDGLVSRGKVVVIGATNRPNALDPALRRPGRFDKEIVIGIPNRDSRLEILKVHTRGMPLDDDVDLDAIADSTHGFVGADLSALCKEAALSALRRVLPETDLEADAVPLKILNTISVSFNDFKWALRGCEPSVLREVLVESPDVSWEQIGGLEDAKQEIRESVEWPQRYPQLFTHMDAEPPGGILLWGPPGTGKTLLAKAVATGASANFISIKGPEFHSKWVGESERAVRETFRRAKQAAPCVVFFDEIDAIAPSRGGTNVSQVAERVVSQMLTELDGLEVMHNVIVIAATNRPDIIDVALLRPGRFDRCVRIGLPDAEARGEIFLIHTKRKPLDDDVSIQELASMTEGYSGADIHAVCNEAVMLAIREIVFSQIDKEQSESDTKHEDVTKYKVSWKHFQAALEKVKPLSEDERETYLKIEKRFSSIR